MINIAKSALSVVLLTVSTLSFSAPASLTFTFKCYSVGQEADRSTWDILTITKKNAKLVTYYDNQVAGEVTIDASGEYEKGGLVGGSGKLAKYTTFNLKRAMKSEPLDTFFVETSLLSGGHPLARGGMGGFLAFVGHGYSYEWRLCVKK